MSAPLEIHLSVAAHTNQGKTTLVRSLVERDVGEVVDRAHVTEEASAHVWIETPEVRLVLWDTPGFGDSARLLRRLKEQRNPLGWLLAQVWDRIADRPLWSSRRALEHLREQGDVVLYQASAAEPPEQAGYLEPELEILAWTGKPVLVVLNVLGPARPPRGVESEEADLARWRSWAQGHPGVQGVLALDAFACTPREELRLLEALRPLVPEDKRAALEKAHEALAARTRERVAAAAGRIAAALAAAASDREPLSEDGRRGRERAAESLRERLRASTRALAEELIELHALEGRSRAEVRAELDDLALRGGRLDEAKAGWIGAVLGGLGSGLLADLLAGGLTLGAGAIVGAAGGWLAGRGLARGQRLLQRGEEPSVAWNDELLERLASEWLVLELLIARHRRGRGPYRDPEPGAGSQAEAWRRAVEARLAPRRAALQALLARAREEPARAEPELARLLGEPLERLATG